MTARPAPLSPALGPVARMASIPLQTMARVLGVSRSGFHAWSSRPAPARSRADAVLADRIAQIHHAWRETYGAPRIHAELADERTRVGRKRVEWLMKLEALLGVSRRKGPRTTFRDPRVRPACDLVSRNVTADAPKQLWGEAGQRTIRGIVRPPNDITHVPTWGGFLYLVVVLDAYSRRIVGWAMGHDLKAQLVIDAMNMAIGQRRPRDVIHHSDQGSQYTSLGFGGRCREAGVRPSMGSVGDAYDNASVARASSPPSSASCWCGASFGLKPRRAWRSFSSSKAGTTLLDATQPSATSPPSRSKGAPTDD